MDRQVVNITLLEDGRLRLKNGRIVVPENEILYIRNGVVCFMMNRNLVCFIDVEDYFKWSLWAHRVTFSHRDTNVGGVTYDNGYEHRSIPALIRQTKPGQRVSYHNNNHCDIRRENLYIIGM